MSHLRMLLVAVFIGALVLAACGGDDSSSQQPTTTQDEMSDDEMSDDDMSDDEMTDDEMTDMNDLMSAISAQGDLTVLDELIHAAGLQDALHSEGPFTIFAPTDAAFGAYGDAMDMSAQDLASDPDALATLLNAHIVEGTDDAEMVMGMDGQSFASLAGTEIEVTVEGETVRVGDATVIEYDIVTDNGVIHVIDAVLPPPG